MFKSLLKAATSVVTIPVAVVADVITLGGAINDKPRPYTAEEAVKLMKNLADATKPERLP